MKKEVAAAIVMNLLLAAEDFSKKEIGYSFLIYLVIK